MSKPTFVITHEDGSLIGWARSPRLAEQLVKQDHADHPERTRDGYSVVEDTVGDEVDEDDY